MPRGWKVSLNIHFHSDEQGNETVEQARERIGRLLEEWDGDLDHVPPGLELLAIQTDIGVSEEGVIQ